MAHGNAYDRATFRARQRGQGALFDLDLLTAAWRWPPDIIARVTERSARQLGDMRHHRLAVDVDLIAIIQDLKSLHYWLWMKPGPASYAAWWRLALVLPDPWGEVVPLQLMRQEGRGAIAPITAYLQSWVIM